MAIKIQGTTIIDDSRNIINSNAIGIGTTNPTTTISIAGTTGISFVDTNIRIGDINTGRSITSGVDNIFCGRFAGNSNTTGSINIFLGTGAGAANTNGVSNQFIGNLAGTNNTSGSHNNFYGYEAGNNNTSGSYNICIGYNAGYNSQTGSENIVIGRSQNPPILNGSNQLIIGSGSTAWINGNSSYNVGLGTTNPTSKLHVVPTSTSIAALFSGTTSSDMVRITQTGSGNAFIVEDETNPDSTPFVVKADGSVGLGTTNPTSKLKVESTSGQIGAWFSGNTIEDIIRITQYGVGDALVIESLDGDSSPFVVRADGSVGIGTVNPTAKLDVRGDLRVNDGSLTVGPGGLSVYAAYSRQLSPQVGTAITTKALAANATRTTDAAIYDYIWDNYSVYDADGDGVVSYNDTLVIVRYLFGTAFQGDALISGITFPSNASRTTATSIRNYIGLHTMGGTGKLDVDGNGDITPLGDGLMISRVFGGGFTNPADNAPARLVTADAAYLNVNNAGLVGIGTTNPTSKLHVVPTSTSIAGLFSGTTSSDMVRINQTGTGNALVVEDETNPDSTPFVITATGSVGVGTANPTSKLHVVPTDTSIAGLFSGTTSSDMVRITQTGTGNALVVEDETNPDSTPFVVKADGSVGIGTTNPFAVPTAKLFVNGNLYVNGATNSAGYPTNPSSSFAASTVGAAYSFANMSPDNSIWSTAGVLSGKTGNRQTYQIAWLNSATVYFYIFPVPVVTGAAAYSFRANISGVNQVISTGSITQYFAGSLAGTFTSDNSAAVTLRTSTLLSGYSTMTPSGSVVNPDFTVISGSPVLRLPRGTASSTNNKTFYSILLEWTVLDATQYFV
jgi:hypothetical protein